MLSWLLALTLHSAQAEAISLQAIDYPTHYRSTAYFINGSIQALPEEPDTTLAWPTTATRISRGISNGHTGVDIDGNSGDPIYAVYDGRVIKITRSGPYGNKIVIAHPDHPDHFNTLYAHLDSIAVSINDTVTKGQRIGTMGTTGYATGSHLHIEILHNTTPIDPLPYLRNQAQ